MSGEHPGEADVDVVQIMSEIRASIQKKRERGIYTETEVESLTDLRLRTFCEDVLIDPRLIEWLHGPGVEWNIAPDYLIRTTRTGPLAWALVAVKKIVRPLVRLYTDHVVNRQAQLNLYLARLLHQNIRETARLQLEIQALRHRCRVLEERAGSRPPDADPAP
jgi:hypothetical protein